MKRPISDDQRDQNEQTRAVFIQRGMEAQLEREIKDAAELNAALDKALDDSDHINTENETTSKWTELKKHAKFAFPQLVHTKFRDILPKHKLIAIADAEGWPTTEIALHGGVSRTLVGRILNKPDVILFQREYKELQGRGDPSTKIVELANLGLGVTKRLLSMATTDPAILRLQLDAAKWSKEQAYPGGRKQNGDLDEAKIMEALTSKTVQLDDDTLFADDRKKKPKTIKATQAMVLQSLADQVQQVVPTIIDNELVSDDEQLE